jgi:hypothetical protein
MARRRIHSPPESDRRTRDLHRPRTLTACGLEGVLFMCWVTRDGHPIPLHKRSTLQPPPDRTPAIFKSRRTAALPAPAAGFSQVTPRSTGTGARTGSKPRSGQRTQKRCDRRPAHARRCVSVLLTRSSPPSFHGGTQVKPDRASQRPAGVPFPEAFPAEVGVSAG